MRASIRFELQMNQLNSLLQLFETNRIARFLNATKLLHDKHCLGTHAMNSTIENSMFE